MSTDNRTELNDCDNVTGFVSDGRTPELDTTTGQRYEGTASVRTQLTNSDEQMHTTQTSGGGGTFNIDLSDSTMYILVKDNLNDTYANGGVQCVIGDGTDLIGYDVGGNDAAGLPLRPFFQCYKLDVNFAAATPGGNNAYSGSEANLSQAAVTQMGYGSLHLAKAVGNVPNVWVDRMTYIANDSYALTINGGTSGTPETMADVQGDDETNGWGMVNNPLGSQYGFFAPTEWGNSAATADVYFTATDEQWYWIGDNGGGRAIGATHFPFRIVGNATDTIDIKWTRVSITNTGTRAQFVAGDTNVNVMQLVGCTFIDLDTITFTTQSAGNRFANDCIFNNCGQVAFSSMDADGCTFNGTTDALGAVEWSTTPADVANQDNFTFNSDGTGHAIEINLNTASLTTYNIDGYTFDGFAGQDGTAGNRVFYIDNALDGDVTINLSNSQALNQVGTGSGFSYEAAPGYTGTVTIVSTVTLTLEGIETDSEVNITNLDDTENFDKTLASSEQISGSVKSAEIVSGGSGYTNGAQTLTVVGGTGTAATLNVTVAGGVVTSVDSIAGAGSYTANPTNPVSTTGGGGTGATFNLDISGEFSYSYDSGNLVNVAIVIFHLDFVEVRLVQQLSATSQTIPIQQRTDRVFNNP